MSNVIVSVQVPKTIAIEINRGQKGDPGGGSGGGGAQGIQGIPGIQGIQGIPGVKGDTGSQGIQGVQGLKGDTGDQGIQGIKGDKGDTGNQGPKGDQGVQGVPGPSGVSGLGLLVYAQQNIALPLESYIYTLIPFSAEFFDPLNLFSGGIFTPAVTGIYRIGCHVAVRASGSINFHGVQFCESSTAIDTLYATDTYVPYATGYYKTELPLTAGTSYNIKVSSGGPSSTIAIGSDIKNSLTIERLS